MPLNERREVCLNGVFGVANQAYIYVWKTIMEAR
jgi:hypothetical protein